MNKRLAAGLLTTAAMAMAGCATPPAAAPAPTIAPVAPAVETTPTAQSEGNTAVMVFDQNGRATLLATGSAGGIEVYGADGVRTGAFAAGSPAGVDARPAGGADANVWTVAALDESTNRIRLFEFNAASGVSRDLTARDINIGFAGESLCLYRDALDRNLYAFALGGGGEIAQYLIFEANGRLDARPARQLHVASEASYCVADDASGDVYIAEQAVGVWRFSANPETETVPELIDAVRLGRITEEVGGLAIYDAGAANYLVASNASANNFHVYDRNQDHAYAGSFQLGATAGGIDGVEVAGGLYATALGVGEQFPQGVLVATDDSNDGGMNYKLTSWADIAGALNLTSGTARDPRMLPTSSVAVVVPSVETAPVETDGDAADDPAIWVNRRNPAQSTIIGTQKQSGLYVYNLDGSVLQFLPDGRMNNVDLRDGFSLNGRSVSLVAASNRTNDSISLYRVDPDTRHLVNVADGVQPTGFADPYGLCMYRNGAGRTFVFVNDTEGGMKQWELLDAGNGAVRTQLVRQFAFSSQTEGCVADDATGVLYVAEEDVGLWRLSAEPDGGDARTSVATVANQPAVKDDLEGIGLYDLGDGRGYLVLSSQGNNTYAVFRREGDNAYVGSFAVAADGAHGIDGSSETDGLEVTSASLGGAYGHGLFVAQDGRNVSPQQNQNFKLVPWSAIAGALRLEQR